MSRALLNIWAKDKNCNILTTAWRMDLVIVSCCGSYLVDQDPGILQRILDKNSHIGTAVKLSNYMGATRIKLLPQTAGDPMNHVEVEVPPGCYVVWARMCHGKNEETNKMQVIATCGSHICVNLLLNNTGTCAAEGIFPIGIAALQRNVDDEMVKNQLQVHMVVDCIKKANLLDQANARIQEFQDIGAPTELQAVNEQLRDLIQELPDD